MDISRRTALSVLGAGIGGIGLAAATGINNSTNEGSETSESDKGDSTEPGDKNDANENEKNEREGSENEGSDGNDRAERDESKDNGNVGSVTKTQQEAERIATRTVGGGTVQRVELEVEDSLKDSGTPVYNVIVKTNNGTIKEVTVNANTGDVVKVDKGA